MSQSLLFGFKLTSLLPFDFILISFVSFRFNLFLDIFLHFFILLYSFSYLFYISLLFYWINCIPFLKYDFIDFLQWSTRIFSQYLRTKFLSKMFKYLVHRYILIIFFCLLVLILKFSLFIVHCLFDPIDPSQSRLLWFGLLLSGLGIEIIRTYYWSFNRSWFNGDKLGFACTTSISLYYFGPLQLPSLLLVLNFLLHHSNAFFGKFMELNSNTICQIFEDNL